MTDSKKQAPPDPKVVICGQSPVSSILFSSHESYKENPEIFSGHENGCIIEWSVQTQRARTSWQAHEHSVIWLAWTVPDKLLSQGRDGVIKLWSDGCVSAWISICEIPCAQFGFCDSAILRHDNNFTLAVPGRKTGHVDIHLIEESILTSAETETQTQLISKFLHSIKPSSVKSVGMCMRIRLFISSSHKSRVLVAFESGVLTLWDVLSGDLLSEVKAYDDTIMAMDCWINTESNVGKCVTGSSNDVLKTWHLVEDKLEESVSTSVTNPGIGAITVREDGKIFASGGWDHRGRIFSLKKITPLAVLKYHTSSVYCVAFAPDKTLATGSKDGFIALWDVYTNK